MRSEEAWQAVGRLTGGTPGPWDDPAVETYCSEFETWGGPHAEEVLLAVVTELVATWEEPWRPSIAEVHDRWRKAMAVRTPMLPPSGVVHCDGSGWKWTEDGLVPCPRCNGALHDVFSDPAKLERWSTGTDLPDLEVGVERARIGLRYIDRREWVNCQPWQENPVEPVVGRLAAWRMYAEVCERAGRDPSKSRFASWAGS